MPEGGFNCNIFFGIWFKYYFFKKHARCCAVLGPEDTTTMLLGIYDSGFGPTRRWDPAVNTQCITGSPDDCGNPGYLRYDQHYNRYQWRVEGPRDCSVDRSS